MRPSLWDVVARSIPMIESFIAGISIAVMLVLFVVVSGLDVRP